MRNFETDLPKVKFFEEIRICCLEFEYLTKLLKQSGLDSYPWYVGKKQKQHFNLGKKTREYKFYNQKD